MSGSETALLDDMADLEEAALTVDGAGGHTAVWAVSVKNMAGCLQEVGSHLALEYEKAGRETSHVWYCDTKQPPPPGTLYVTISDIIRNSSECRLVYRKWGQTRYFEVEGRRDFVSRGRLSRLDLVERDDGWIKK